MPDVREMTWPRRCARPVRWVTPAVGGSTERMTAFIAELPDPVAMGGADGDGNEQIAVWRMTFEEAWRQMETRRIETASSMILLRELKIMDLAAKTRP